MNFFEKIAFHVTRVLRMGWFSIRYSINKWKKIHGISIPVRMSMGYSVLRFIDNGQYEHCEISIIKDTLEKDDVVLELGSGLGFVSAFCAKRIGDGNVYTFEANSELKPIIESVYQKNRVRPQMNFAMLGDKKGIKEFYTDHGNFLASSVHRDGDDKTKAQVSMLALNEVIASIQPTYLMMDIEGGEYDIFRIIDFQSIRKIQFELHPAVLDKDKVAAIFDRLANSGFTRIDTFKFRDNFYFERNN